MKHLHLFENQSIQLIRNAINVFNKFLEDIKPAVFEKYDIMAEEYNENNKKIGYVDGPEYGNTPHDTADWSSKSSNDNGFEFELEEYDRHGESIAKYYISFSDEELKNAFINLDAKKYNI